MNLLPQKIPGPKDITRIREQLGLTDKDFGELLNYSDAARVTRALELGMRHGKEYRISGPAYAALLYAMALSRIMTAPTAAHRDAAIRDAARIIPKKMRNTP